jgi:23S rRNA-/tRNA-specific pseudouridylate synthase
MIGRSKEFAQEFGKKMMSRSSHLKKIYFARVSGKFPVLDEVKMVRIRISPKDKKAGTWMAVESGKYDACTFFHAMCYNQEQDTTLLMCRPITGRTHQIRIHLEAIKCPIANDPLYNKQETNEETEDEPPSKRQKLDSNADVDPLCKDCVLENKEYTKEEFLKTQMIYLHAWTYIHDTEPVWKYKSEMPGWVKDDLEEAKVTDKRVDEIAQALTSMPSPGDLEKAEFDCDT